MPAKPPPIATEPAGTEGRGTGPPREPEPVAPAARPDRESPARSRRTRPSAGTCRATTRSRGCPGRCRGRPRPDRCRRTTRVWSRRAPARAGPGVLGEGLDPVDKPTCRRAIEEHDHRTHAGADFKHSRQIGKRRRQGVGGLVVVRPDDQAPIAERYDLAGGDLERKPVGSICSEGGHDNPRLLESGADPRRPHPCKLGVAVYAQGVHRDVYRGTVQRRRSGRAWPATRPCSRLRRGRPQAPLETLRGASLPSAMIAPVGKTLYRQADPELDREHANVAEVLGHEQATANRMHGSNESGRRICGRSDHVVVQGPMRLEVCDRDAERARPPRPGFRTARPRPRKARPGRGRSTASRSPPGRGRRRGLRRPPPAPRHASAVRRITSGDPAWKPQAMLTLDTLSRRRGPPL